MRVADMHCDTVLEIIDGNAQSLRENGLHIDLTKLKKGDYLVQNFAMFVHMARDEHPFERCMQMIDVYYNEIEANKDIIRPAFSYQDIIDNDKAGFISSLLTIEEGQATLGDVRLLRDFYRLGVRMLTLTWNYENELGYPNKSHYKNRTKEFHGVPETEHGLKEKGIEYIHEMERLGMIVDVSHLSDAGFYDVYKYSTKPFVASHSNARSVCSHVRNLTDDMIRKLAERGGVTGMNYEGEFLLETQDISMAKGTVDDIVRHVKHISNVGGCECIGLGSDFDGINTNNDLYDASCMPLLADRLKKAGFNESQIEGFFYKNVLRVYKEILI